MARKINTSEGNRLPSWLKKSIVAALIFMLPNTDAKIVELTKTGRKALTSSPVVQ